MSRILLFMADQGLIKAIESALPEHLREQDHILQDFDKVQQLLKSGKVGFLFVDFGLPDMAGFRILQAIRNAKVDVKTVVFSEKLDQDAKEMILALGSFDAIKSPPSEKTMVDVFARLSLDDENTPPEAQVHIDPLLEIYYEVAEESLSGAVKKMNTLSQVDHTLIGYNVNTLECCAYPMLLDEIKAENTTACFVQSFYGAGIAGEIVNVLYGDKNSNTKALFPTENVDTQKYSLLAQIANQAFLKHFASQIDTPLHLCKPDVLAKEDAENLREKNKTAWTENLVFESEYQIEDLKFRLLSLFFFPEKSSETLKHKISHLLE